MNRFVLVALAACSSSATTPPAPAPAAHHPPIAIPNVIHGGHAAAIEIVAATDDGRAAVTQDAMGGTRLWPTLDGTHEPVVVHLVAVRELALGRDGSGFVVAGLDPAGALELVRVGPTGATMSRTQIGGDVAVEQIAMTARGVLALRADQTLLVLDASGRETARLVPPPGKRITSVMARGGHAIALLTDHEVRAREITTAPVSWGRESPGFELAIARPVLAPDGKHLAMQTTTGVRVVDLVTGVVAPKPICVEPHEDTLLGQGNVQPVAPIGFVDKTTLACVALGRIGWWNLDGTKLPREPIVATPETASVADALTVISDRESLALASAETTQFLGYGIANPELGRSGPLGLAIGRGNTQLVLDAALHTRKRYDLPPDPRELDDALPLDDTHVLISRSDVSTGEFVHRLEIVDLAAHKTTPLPFAATAYELRYEPTTHLLAVIERDHVTLAVLDPSTFHVDTRSRLAGTAQYVFLTDPALANGLVAIVVHTGNGRVAIDQLAAKDLGGAMKPRTSYEVFGDLLAIDRAGRTYVLDDDVHVYTAGEWHQPRRVAKLAGLGHVLIRPNSDATKLLVIGDNRLQMFDLDGKQRWMVAAPTAVDGAWIDGEPYVRFAAGLASIDPSTGALLDRACGWGFGLSPAPFEAQSDSRSVCDEG